MIITNGTVIAAFAALAVLLALAVIVRRALRARAGARALAEAEALRRDQPLSLHPVIDADVCIGSLSCLKACPEGDILGLVGNAARLVHGDHCVGHGRCAAECPVGAIQLVFGSARRGVDLPEVDEFFEASRPGVHVVGELGGMGLVKNAMRQGLECAEYLAEALRGGPRAGPAADLVIVGSGPAGLATALGARAAGLSYRLLEQDRLGGTVAHYPRQKVVMTEAVDLPYYGRFGKRRIGKAELMESFRRIVARGGLHVEEGVRVTGVEGQDGAFQVLTERGERIACRKVVLAVGRRGTPRRLGVPGEELEKVTYALTDPEQYRGARVLVVGGGDAALEAAFQLVEEGQAQVTLSYRGDALARARAENRARVEGLARTGRLELLLGSQVRSVGPREVLLDVQGAPRSLPNDYVIVQIGGELPLELLEKAGVSLRRYFGEAPGSRRQGDPARERYLKAGLQRERTQRRFEHRLALGFTLLGAAVLAFLAWHSLDPGALDRSPELPAWHRALHASYYGLSRAERRASPLHAALRSAGPWGHGVGIAATLFMLSNFLYAARKRLRFMSGWGGIRSWLHFHTFVGFMSPLVILFHAAFQSKNLLATATAASLAVVVVTGIIGRYVYGLVPAGGGRAEELEDLTARVVRLRDEVTPLLEGSRDPARLKRLMNRVAAPIQRRSLLLMLLTLPFRRLGARLDLRRARRLFPRREAWLEFHDAFLRMERLRVQITFYRSLKRLLGGWRVFHASLAVFLVFVIAAHIGLSLYLGYGLLHLR